MALSFTIHAFTHTHALAYHIVTWPFSSLHNRNPSAIRRRANIEKPRALAQRTQLVREKIIQLASFSLSYWTFKFITHFSIRTLPFFFISTTMLSIFLKLFLSWSLCGSMCLYWNTVSVHHEFYFNNIVVSLLCVNTPSNWRVFKVFCVLCLSTFFYFVFTIFVFF